LVFAVLHQKKIIMTIFVDMDEVIADTYGAHLELYNLEFNAQLKPEDCQGKGVRQCVPEQHRPLVKEYTSRNGFFRNLKVFPDSQEVLRELCKNHEVYIASAAMEYPNSLRDKSDWLDEHFPFIPWQKRILCGDKFILKGDLLIDDHYRNLKPFEGRKIMFTSPHNIDVTEFERVDNWREIADKLL
jgi:5'(3')-deoxyribonucleotidase